MNARLIDDAQMEMSDALRITVRRCVSMKGSPLAEDFSRCYGDSAGKLIRGLLTLKIAWILSGDFGRALPAGCAVELIHLSGIIVDDWMDSAKVRRGRPTVASRYGTVPTLAIARHLLYTAFAQLATYDSQELLKRAQSTLEAMVTGQRMEFRKAQFAPWLQYRRCISGKTAVLFSLAAEGGAVVAGASKRHRRCAREFGHAIGMAFQIVDDHLDYFGSECLGKHLGMDFLAGIRTAPLLLFARRAVSHARKVRTLMSAPSRTMAQFEDLRAHMLSDGIAAETLAVARSYTERAMQHLAELPLAPGRDALQDWAIGLVTREV